MGANRVYIGGVPKGTTERDLERFFRGYGKLREILLKRGFAFVEFEDHRDAGDAVYDLDGAKLLGERVSVDIARGVPRGRDKLTASRSSRRPKRVPTRTNYRLIVENLSSHVSWQDLKDFMRQAGEVTYADAHKRRNEGVVEFASYHEMKKAIQKFDNVELHNRRIRLVENKIGSDRRVSTYSSRSRSRSRSPRRSRSHSRARYSRSRSQSKRKSRSRTRSVVRDRESKSKSRSRSNSRERSMSRPHSRHSSHSKNKSKSRSRSKARKMSVDRFRSNSKEKSRDRSHSSVRSPSPKRQSRSRGENSRSKNGWSKSRSRSTSKNLNRSRSRTRSTNYD